MMRCDNPSCRQGLDGVRYCWDCGGHGGEDLDVREGGMDTVSAISLILIATVQVARGAAALTRWLRARRPMPEVVTRDRFPTIYVPLACGIATTFDGLTDACARRRGHGGKCLSDAEIAYISERAVDAPWSVVVEPSSPTIVERDAFIADLAELGRHVDACPVALMIGDSLTVDERAWITRSRLMIEALVAGDRSVDFGDTRG